MQFDVFYGLDFDKIFKIAPKYYKRLLTKKNFGGIYDVIILPADKVILSRIIVKAINKIEANEGREKLIIGYCFTSESKSIMDKHNIRYFESHPFPWTDNSYIHVGDHL